MFLVPAYLHVQYTPLMMKDPRFLATLMGGKHSPLKSYACMDANLTLIITLFEMIT